MTTQKTPFTSSEFEPIFEDESQPRHHLYDYGEEPVYIGRRQPPRAAPTRPDGHAHQT
jgi:hypothetical protein